MLLMPSSASVTCVKFHSPFHTESDNSLDIMCQWVLRYIFSYLNWWCHHNIHNVTPPSLRRVEHVACYLDCPPASSGWVPVAVCARRQRNHYWTQGCNTEQKQVTDYTQLHWRQSRKNSCFSPILEGWFLLTHSTITTNTNVARGMRYSKLHISLVSHAVLYHCVYLPACIEFWCLAGETGN